eukprot:TRINITY_DN1403_c0_g1_i2.p1 TRINITY_DN1403_c0_g1~~TRINITY_DN1403_c0_g1_i2.p1  ORF type:complete len:752 (+),score=281.07 TRINITY_DN1403_c0_g1_i2:141-2396(+)
MGRIVFGEDGKKKATTSSSSSTTSPSSQQLNNNGANKGKAEAKVDEMKAKAAMLYKQQVQIWEEKQGTDTSLRDLIRKGTTADKVNSYVLLIQKSPYHRITTLDPLLNMAHKSVARESRVILESIRDLFSATLLPSHKLQTIQQHLSLNSSPSDQELAQWYYDECLKSYYLSFIQLLEKGAHDNLYEYKKFVISTVKRLLSDKPEQEQTLLSILIDKLGDKDPKAAAFTSNLILELLKTHPNMRTVVAKEIQLFLIKHHQFIYYAITVINQILLQQGDEDLANLLVSSYFHQITANIMSKQNKRVDVKMTSAVLTGIHRAIPFTKISHEKYNEYLTYLFDLIVKCSFHRKLTCVSLIFQLIRQQQATSKAKDVAGVSRYYSTLYDLLLSPELLSTIGLPRAMQGFLQTYYMAIKEDTTHARASIFVKRLLLVCANTSPNLACAILLLVSRLCGQVTHIRQSLFGKIPASSSSTLTMNGISEKLEKAFELTLLVHHYHPLVAKFATILSNQKAIVYKGHPLESQSSSVFLAKIQNKKAAVKERKKGAVKELQPKKSEEDLPTFSFSVKDVDTIKPSDVLPDEMFFYTYLKCKAATLQRSEDNKRKSASEGKISMSDVLEAEGATEGINDTDVDFGTDSEDEEEDAAFGGEEEEEDFGGMVDDDEFTSASRPAKRQKSSDEFGDVDDFEEGEFVPESDDDEGPEGDEDMDDGDEEGDGDDDDDELGGQEFDFGDDDSEEEAFTSKSKKRRLNK